MIKNNKSMQTIQSIESSEGFALLTVLVISFLGSLVVFDTVKENVNQERMAGNYSKELNARIQSENGLASAYNMLSGDSTMSSDTMMTSLNATQPLSGAYHYQLGAWVPTSTLASTNISIKSDGAHYEGNYKMHGSISLVPGGGNPAFVDAITTCDGGVLGGSGKVDSYDSSLGNYGGSNIGNSGDVSVINEDASGLNLSGGTLISGDVSNNGDLNISNGYIYGDAHVSGDATIGPNNSGSASVGGSIKATGDVFYGHSGIDHIADSISSNGNVSIGQSTFTGDITYGGKDGGTLTSAKDASTFASTSMKTSDHVEAVGTKECDILKLGDEFNDVTDGIGSLAASTNVTAVPFGGNNTSYTISDSGLIDTHNNQVLDTQTETVDFLGKPTDVYVLDINNFGYEALSMTVESGSDVTIYLKGDTTLSGSINIEDGGSLTIITNDKVTMGSDGKITNLVDEDANGIKDGIYDTPTSAAVNSDKEISTILYSGYDSNNKYDYGISVAGGSNSTFTAYAPEASINISGGGDIYGSLRSDYLNISGGAGIHFDEQLPNVNLKADDSATLKPAIERWF